MWNIFKATPESAPTEISATDDTIIGVNTTMEYRKQGDSGYTPVSDTTISALTPGTYYVRVKGDDNHNPSPVTVVTVKEPTLDVKTLQPSGLTSTAATLNGVVAPYDESKDYKIQFLLNDEVCNGTPTVEKGVFTLIVTDLKPDADYTVKAVVNNTESAPVIFHTPKATPPTEDIGSITVNAAVEDGTAATFIVSVERGNDVIASKQLSGSSTSFTELPYGNYNVVIRTNDGNYTETKMLSVADAQEVTVDFLDMSLLKTTTELDADGNPTSINAQDIGATNNKVLEIAVPYNNTNKTLKVLRYHNGMAEELTKLDARPSAPFMDGTYFVGDGYVFIYASGFSTYAIGYEQESSGDGGRGGKTTTYAITGADTQNGKLTLSGKFASAGRTVTVKVTPDEGYKLDTLTAKDAKGNALTLTRVDDNTYTFQMPASKVTVSATFAKDEGGEADTGVCKQDESCVYAKFPDADPKAWYHPGVHFCVEKGYMNGVRPPSSPPAALCPVV